jgi:hypothetical protein
MLRDEPSQLCNDTNSSRNDTNSSRNDTNSSRNDLDYSRDDASSNRSMQISTPGRVGRRGGDCHLPLRRGVRSGP